MTSIGLLVDFIMHVLLRYYESTEKTREGKTRDALESMGSSLLLGGLSTFLGIMPLAFSTSQLLRSVFISYAGMIGIGLTHGLVVLPVILSLVGTTDCIRLDYKEELFSADTQKEQMKPPSRKRKLKPQIQVEVPTGQWNATFQRDRTQSASSVTVSLESETSEGTELIFLSDNIVFTTR